jgi:hypothetical protein
VLAALAVMAVLAAQVEMVVLEILAVLEVPVVVVVPSTCLDILATLEMMPGVKVVLDKGRITLISSPMLVNPDFQATREIL